MNLIPSLEFFLGYNLEVIAWLFVLITLGVLFLIWRSQFEQEKSKSVVEELLNEFIEFKESLSSNNEELISQAQQEALIQNEEKESEQEMTSDAQGDELSIENNSDEVKSLKDQLDQLQAKLHEYEIIEEDIADLSTYKEENVRLKEELEKLKGVEATQEQESEESQPGEKIEKPETEGLEVAIEAAESEVEGESEEVEAEAESSQAVEGGSSEEPSEDDKKVEDLADDVMAEFFVNKEVESDPTKMTQGEVTPAMDEDEDKQSA